MTDEEFREMINKCGNFVKIQITGTEKGRDSGEAEHVKNLLERKFLMPECEKKEFVIDTVPIVQYTYFGGVGEEKLVTYNQSCYGVTEGDYIYQGEKIHKVRRKYIRSKIKRCQDIIDKLEPRIVGHNETVIIKLTGEEIANIVEIIADTKFGLISAYEAWERNTIKIKMR